MRAYALAVILTALSATAQAQEVSGNWVSDVTGEPVAITRKEAVFARLGTFPLSWDGGVMRLTLKSGMLGATACTYQVTPLRGDRMAWFVTDGPAECPRGSFSRSEGGRPPITRDDRSERLPPAVRDRSTPVRSVEALVGKWYSRENDENFVVTKGMFGTSIELASAGSGDIRVAGDPQGSIQATFPKGSCSLTGRMVDGDLHLEAVQATPGCPVGVFTRNR